MDLIDTLRTTPAVREFGPEKVDEAVIARVLEVARFAPSGGNRQAWHVVVVEDPATRAALRDCYLTGWYEYVAQTEAGLTPWAPVTDRSAEAAALARAPEIAAQAVGDRAGFAEHLDTAPALLAVLADLRALAASDRDLDRYSFVGGASVYPFVWSILLAARAQGLGGVMTTMAVRREADVLDLFGAPEGWGLAAVVVLGHPVRHVTRLRRGAVESFTTVDRFDGRPVSDPR